MHVLVVYDVTDDRRRLKIADACLDYGLDRIQLSAFAGTLSRNHQEELMMKIGRLLGEGEGTIHLYPVDMKRKLIVGAPCTPTGKANNTAEADDTDDEG